MYIKERDKKENVKKMANKPDETNEEISVSLQTLGDALNEAINPADEFMLEWIEECKKLPLYPLLFKRPGSFATRDMHILMKYIKEEEEKGIDMRDKEIKVSKIRSLINEWYLESEERLVQIIPHQLGLCRNCENTVVQVPNKHPEQKNFTEIFAEIEQLYSK